MCGRVNVIDNPELQQLLRELGIDLGLPTRSNIAPTETIAMIRSGEQGNELAQVRWWLTPRWAKQVDQKCSMFNARSETIATSRAFAEPFKRRRGIVPISSFIEWRSEQGGRQPYLISSTEGALALAAIWDRWEGKREEEHEVIETCAVVTTAAAPQFEQLHKRMPVILVGEERQRWLDCDQVPAANEPLFAPQLKTNLQILPLSREVNNARSKDIGLLQAVADGFLLEVE